MIYRPDLAALEVNAPTGYIGEDIFPTETRNEKAGNITYMPVIADVAAQTNRVDYVAPDAVNIATAVAAYSAGEIIKRFSLSFLEKKAIGNDAKAEEMAAGAAKRSVMAALETKKATKLFGVSATNALVEPDAGELLAAIKDSVKDIKRYSGETALVLSFEAYNAVTALAEITGKLSYQGFNFSNPSDVLSIQTEVLQSMLQGLFGVSRILIGDDDCWVKEDQLVVCKLPSKEFMSYKANPELGRTIMYLIDGENFEMGVSENDEKMCFDFTAMSFADVVQFNEGAKKVIAIPSA